MTVRRAVTAVALVSVFLSPAVPAVADVTEAEVDEARATARAIAGDLDAEQERLDTASEALWVLEDRVAALGSEIALADRHLAADEIDLRDRVAQVYMRGGGDSAGQAFGVGGLEILAVRLVYADAVASDDLEEIGFIRASQLERERLGEELEVLLVRQTELLDEIAATTEVILDELEKANGAYRTVKQAWDEQEAERVRREEQERRRREEEERKRREAAALVASTQTNAQPVAPVAVAPTGKTCPVDGATTFRDTWGAPRPGGRTHKGTDLSAAYGTPLVAIESGTVVQLSNHVAGGLGVYLQGAESRFVYYYAHLSAFADGIGQGTRVNKGQVLGWVGTTGNATAPNLHLGLMPGSLDLSRLQNPYGLMVDLCR